MLKKLLLMSITTIIASMIISCGVDYVFSPYYKDGGEDTDYVLKTEDQKELDLNFSLAESYRTSGEGTGRVYRNPSFLGSSYGYLLAFYEYRKYSGEIGVDGEKICDIQIKKSVNGKTFESFGSTIGKSASNGTESHGSPVSFYANNKDLVLLSSSGMGFSTNDEGESKISISKSYDDGKKWSDWRDIDDSVFRDLKNQGFDRFYPVSGNGITLSDGTLACALDIGSTNNKGSGKTVKHLGFAILYSRDNGENWKVGGVHKYSEEDSYKNAKIVAKTSDKSILIVASPKNKNNEGYAKWFKAYDLTSSINEWSEGAKIKSNGGKIEGMKLRGGNRIVLTYADESNALWLAVSEDEGRTFETYKKKLNETKPCYNSTARGLIDGTIAFFYEFTIDRSIADNTLYILNYRRISVNWLTDGTEDYYVGW